MGDRLFPLDDLGEDPTRHYHRGNPQSQAAHASIRGDKRRQLAIVLRYLRERGEVGATCDEIEAATGLRHQTASARCTEGKQLGYLYDSGRRRVTRSGRTAAVLVASPPS
jgi:hypothetical protein